MLNHAFSSSAAWGETAIVAAVLCFIVLGAGCTYETVVHDSWDNLRKLSDDKGGSTPAQRAGLNSDDPGFAILMATFQGDNARDVAHQTLTDLRQTEQVPDLWVKHREGDVLLYRGRYVKQDDPQALSDLRQSRMIKVGNKRPFSEAHIVAVGTPKLTSSDEMDLHNYVGKYTLQIAFFDEAGGPTFRKAAEQYAKTLRAQREEAYYYHGPYLSLVTIGIFTESDFERQGNTSVYGPRIRQLREKYPHNIGNGATVIEKMAGKEVGVQQSFLVRVPE